MPMAELCDPMPDPKFPHSVPSAMRMFPIMIEGYRFADYTFTCGKDTVTLKPEEIMAALKSQ
jgi:hypothetical protein